MILIALVSGGSKDVVFFIVVQYLWSVFWFASSEALNFKSRLGTGLYFLEIQVLLSNV
jgi:hypothetical protein